MARLILTGAGEDVEVGGNVTVVGTTSPGDEITVLGGNITFDASFNVGGDIIRLPGVATDFTVRIVGSTVILKAAAATIRVPIGTSGMQVAFDDVSRTLIYDSATATSKLGDQTITVSETGVLPIGVAGQQLGTGGSDTINGTSGDDVIDALGGNDTVNGGAGDDFLRGGEGDDTLTGGLDGDEISGGAGNDHIIDNEGDFAFLDGDIGNDRISVNNLEITGLNIGGGDGDDIIDVTVGRDGFASVNAGSGADRVTIDSKGMEVTVELGTGRDEVVLPAGSLGEGEFGLVILVDLDVGASGDKVELANALNSYLQNYTPGSNAFATGHLRLIDVFGNAFLQVDRDGPNGSGQFKDLINYAGIDTDALTADNLGGFDPSASIAAAPTANRFASAGTMDSVMLAPAGMREAVAFQAEGGSQGNASAIEWSPNQFTHYESYYFLV